jgi:hypothetical protein
VDEGLEYSTPEPDRRQDIIGGGVLSLVISIIAFVAAIYTRAGIHQVFAAHPGQDADELHTELQSLLSQAELIVVAAIIAGALALLQLFDGGCKGKSGKVGLIGVLAAGAVFLAGAKLALEAM